VLVVGHDPAVHAMDRLAHRVLVGDRDAPSRRAAIAPSALSRPIAMSNASRIVIGNHLHLKGARS
jgi:hypothetical protein